jgi:YD repeat-containing protein
VSETLDTSTRSVSYAYDGLLRLTDAGESGTTTNTYAYGYDLAGNRTSATVNGVTTTRGSNAANQVTGWSYDATGNLLSDGTTTSTYDIMATDDDRAWSSAVDRPSSTQAQWARAFTRSVLPPPTAAATADTVCVPPARRPSRPGFR